MPDLSLSPASQQSHQEPQCLQYLRRQKSDVYLLPQTKARTAGKLAREADCMAAVQDCEGVVRLRGLYEDASSAYVVMDHCAGGDLEELVQVCFLFGVWAVVIWNLPRYHL